MLTTTFTVPRERARAFGIFGALAGGGGAIGLLLGGYLTQDVGWRWNLYINVVIAIVAIVAAIFLVPTIARSGPRPKLDIPGTVLVSGGLFSLVYGFSNAETDSWSAPLTWGMLIAAGVLLVSFVLWQRRAAHPLLPLSVVLDRNRAAAYLSILIAGASMFGIFLFLTYYMQTALKFTPIKTGLALLPMVAMLVLFAQLGTNIFVPRFGPKILVPIGMVLGVIGMLILTQLTRGQRLRRLRAAGAADPGRRDGHDHARLDADPPPSVSTASSPASPRRMTNTSQQVGGSISTALLNTLAASAATGFVAVAPAGQPGDRRRGRGARIHDGVRALRGVLRRRAAHRRAAVPRARPGAVARAHRPPGRSLRSRSR